ncbi:MAG: threonylcarbamoyl-AMP synthase [Desulfarculus sp.]|nr:threonylcarbamoyl-AMP synthase [Desulfarculus sp.]
MATPPTITLDPANPGQALLARAAGVLAEGGLVIYPTETLYGIAADYRNDGALARLVVLKGRDGAKPFPLILASPDEVDSLALAIPPQARELMARFWPGPLTLVLAARPGLSPRLLSPEGGVGLRVSSHPVAAGLAAGLGRAITATSANLAGQPPASRVEDLAPALLAGVDLVLDAGPTPGGPPSTVLDARAWPPKVLRQGAITIQALGLAGPRRPEC